MQGEREREDLGHPSQLAPTTLQATKGLHASSIAVGPRTAASGRAAAREHTTERCRGRSARRVCGDHVPGPATTNVVDRRHATHFTFQFLVEAEHGAFTAAVDVAGASTTRLVGARGARVQAGERGRARRIARVGGFGVLQADDIAGTSAGSMNGWPRGTGHGWVRFDDVVVG